MSIAPKYIHEDKHCFVQCPPESCDCKAGNRIAWALQQAPAPKRNIVAQGGTYWMPPPFLEPISDG